MAHYNMNEMSSLSLPLFSRRVPIKNVSKKKKKKKKEKTIRFQTAVRSDSLIQTSDTHSFHHFIHVRKGERSGRERLGNYN